MNWSSEYPKTIAIGSNKYTFSENHILGKGTTGYVYKGKTTYISGVRNIDGITVAIKAINLRNQTQN
jgi:predicted Ser/Thr protein kinase